MVVDDEDYGPALKDTLEANNYNTVLFRSGMTALNQIDNIQYDMALVDLQLGDMDGDDLIRILKQKNPRIPMIIISWYEAKSMHADGSIPKVIGERDFLEEIKRYF